MPFNLDVLLKKANNLINRIHERSIQIVSGDNEGNFENLLEKNKKIIILQRNLQVLAIKVYKIINGCAPPIMGNFFIFKENTYNLRNFQVFKFFKFSIKTKKAVIYGSKTISDTISHLYQTPLL